MVPRASLLARLGFTATTAPKGFTKKDFFFPQLEILNLLDLEGRRNLNVYRIPSDSDH